MSSELARKKTGEQTTGIELKVFTPDENKNNFSGFCAGNRVSASLRFSLEQTKKNSDVFLDSLKDIKLWLSPYYVLPIMGPPIAALCCYVYAPMTSFLYAMAFARYCPEEKKFVV